MNRSILAVPLLLVLFLCAASASAEAARGGYALAEFSVSGLSCGSCVNNVREALAGVAGVGDVEVSVTRGRATVEYLAGRTDAEALAARIGAAGYPATVARTLSAAEYRALAEDRAALADRFVGRVGARLIGRDDFAAALARFEVDGSVPSGGLLKAVWQTIVQRQLLLAAAEASGVVVQEGEVDLEMKRRNVAASERAALKEDLVIGRNLEEHVLAGEHDPLRRRALLDAWYRDLAAATVVEIFDPALQTALEGGGCGGSCCG